MQCKHTTPFPIVFKHTTPFPKEQGAAADSTQLGHLKVQLGPDRADRADMADMADRADMAEVADMADIADIAYRADMADRANSRVILPTIA